MRHSVIVFTGHQVLKMFTFGTRLHPSVSLATQSSNRSVGGRENITIKWCRNQLKLLNQMMAFTGIFPQNTIHPPSLYALPFLLTQNTGQCKGARSFAFTFLSRLQAVKMVHLGIAPTLPFSEKKTKLLTGKKTLGRIQSYKVNNVQNVFLSM